MGKRSNFERIERDFYPTPVEPVLDLSPHLPAGTVFAEPCVGNGALADHLCRLGHCLGYASDIEPIGDALAYADWQDALALTAADLVGCNLIITNPPWPMPRNKGQPTIGLIRHLSRLLPTWLLLSADFAHNAYAAEVMDYCRMVVSVGRVQWIPGSDNTGKDNAAWYLFDHDHVGETVFVPRRERRPVYAADLEDLL